MFAVPVTCSKPVKVVKNPQFCATDTTYLADRAVASITVGDTVISLKQFVTNTGIIIPSVDLPTRSKILNMAHAVGLTHSRVVEVMGRAVAQAVLPLLGDSYRWDSIKGKMVLKNMYSFCIFLNACLRILQVEP